MMPTAAMRAAKANRPTAAATPSAKAVPPASASRMSGPWVRAASGVKMVITSPEGRPRRRFKNPSGSRISRIYPMGRGASIRGWLDDRSVPGRGDAAAVWE